MSEHLIPPTTPIPSASNVPSSATETAVDSSHSPMSLSVMVGSPVKIIGLKSSRGTTFNGRCGVVKACKSGRLCSIDLEGNIDSSIICSVSLKQRIA